jgi:uncharacterized Tic20 family protein
LAVWVTRRDRDPFNNDAGREALNFGISIAVYGSLLLVAALMLVGRHPPADGWVIAWVTREAATPSVAGTSLPALASP